MLKSKYATKAEIPAGLEAHYIEKDGAWILEGDFSDHPSFVGLRENRDTLLTEKKTVAKELAEARTALDGVKTAAGISDISELPAVLKGKQGQSKEDEEKRFAERITSMKTDWEKKEKEYMDRNAAHESQLQTLLIDNALQAEATAAGVLPAAMPDVLRRGRETYKLVEGKPVPMEGDKTIYGKDGVSPMPVTEWFGKLTADAPHLFKPSQGGGANPGAGKGGGTAVAIDPNLSPVEMLKAARR